MFEGAIVRYAARHATPKEIERLGLALAKNRRSLDDPDEFIRSDMEFHLVLAEIPQNAILLALHHALSSWLKSQRTTSIAVSGSTRTVYQDHARVYRAIAAHDVEAADRAMAGHLARVSGFYWEASLDARPAGVGPRSRKPPSP